MKRIAGQSAQLRPLNTHADQSGVAQLDLSFRARRIFVVDHDPTGFALVEEESSPPLEGRYAEDWSELAKCEHVMVAEQAGRIVGIAALTISERNRRATVAHHYIDRAWRGRGIGRQLMATLEQEATCRGARALWVETQNVNLAACRFYQACGFALCGLDTTLYDPELAGNETALFFAKRIASVPVPSLGDNAAAV